MSKYTGLTLITPSNPYNQRLLKAKSPLSQAPQGEREIRTPETLITSSCFQDRCIQPLCHLSRPLHFVLGALYAFEADIRNQHRGHRDAPIGVLVVLEDRYERASYRQA